MFSIAYHQCKWNYKDEADVKQVDDGTHHGRLLATCLLFSFLLTTRTGRLSPTCRL